MNTQNEYKSIFKITSLLSGLQLFQILFSILRTKVVAIFLGPSGMGLFGILNNTLNTFGSFVNLGISTSAVRQISKESNNDDNNIPSVIKILRILSLLTGFAGSIVLFFLASKISLLLFNNINYSRQIRIIAFVILIIQITNVNLAILQGTKKLKELTLTNIIGNFIALIFSLPIIIYFKKDGIPYAIIVTNLFLMLASFFYIAKIKNLSYIKIKLHYFLDQSKEILKIGIVLSMSGVLVNLNSYFTQLFITRTGSLSDLGLYTASYSLVVSYVGLILNAMSTEYYPRLCRIFNDDIKTNSVINTQAEILTLLITPIIICFYLFSNLAIKILYTKDFLPIQTLINLMVFGMIFRTLSWCISFVFSAKGHVKSFFFIELSASIYSLTLNILFYKNFGLNGLGYAFILTYFIYLFQVYYVAQFIYKFKFSKDLLNILLKCILLLTLIYLTSFISYSILRYIISIPLLLISCFYSFSKIFPDKFVKNSYN